MAWIDGPDVCSEPRVCDSLVALMEREGFCPAVRSSHHVVKLEDLPVMKPEARVVPDQPFSLVSSVITAANVEWPKPQASATCEMPIEQVSAACDAAVAEEPVESHATAAPMKSPGAVDPDGLTKMKVACSVQEMLACMQACQEECDRHTLKSDDVDRLVAKLIVSFESVSATLAEAACR